MDRQIAGAMGELGNIGATFRLGQNDALEVGGREHLKILFVMLGA